MEGLKKHVNYTSIMADKFRLPPREVSALTAIAAAEIASKKAAERKAIARDENVSTTQEKAQKIIAQHGVSSIVELQVRLQGTKHWFTIKGLHPRGTLELEGNIIATGDPARWASSKISIHSPVLEFRRLDTKSRHPKKILSEFFHGNVINFHRRFGCFGPLP